jgi:hypothetical protein
VVCEKGSPRLGRRFPVPGHVSDDCCLRQLYSNLQQFPMNAWSTPSRVGEAHLTNQLPNFRRYGRATIEPPTLPSPIEAKSLAMPGDNRPRFDEERCRSPIVPQAREPGPQDAVGPAEREAMPTARTLQDQELMA